MPQYHIAFVNHSAYPHINPTLSLVAALVRRGCRVTYLTSSKFYGTICALGAECSICPIFDASTEAAPANERHQQWWTWDDISVFYEDFVSFADLLIPELISKYEQDRPDLILYDSLMFGGRVLAEKFGIPAVQMTPIFAYHDVYFTRRSGICYTPPGFIEFGNKLDRFFNRHGVLGRGQLFHKESLNIHFFPKAFQFAAETFDERFLFAGGCIAERPVQGEWDTSDGDKPVIMVSASTTSYCTTDYFNTFFDALRDLPWRAVMAVGDSVDPESFERVPDNVELHRYLPYPLVLPRTWLNICHGGTSTIVESLHHGVALICISQSAEPAEYSDRVVELGVGLHISQKDLTSDVLRKAVLGVSADAGLLQRVKAMQEAIRQESVGAEEVASRLMKYFPDEP